MEAETQGGTSSQGSTPQSGTSQDRLVKELRVRGISTFEEANEILHPFERTLSRRPC